jgi:hypothetical protein
MELNVRRLTENDWDTLVKWWKQWDFEFIPSKEFLPDNGTGGLIVEKENKPIASVFMYTTNSGVCALGWPLSDRNYKHEDRSQAIKLLNIACENVWKKHNGKFLFFWGNNRKYISNLKEIGFIEGDTNYSHLIKQI